MRKTRSVLLCLMIFMLVTVCFVSCNTHTHTVVIDAAVAPTDTADGLTEGKHCSECGEVLVKQEVVLARLQGTDIKSNLLAVRGETIVGAVPNATETFSFSDDLTLANGASFVLAKDKDCMQTIAEKAVSLQPGDNVYYVLVTNGDEQTLYTVTLRRRPMHTVSFVADGGTAVDSQIVEEGKLATKPLTDNVTRKGYIFAGWSYDFTQPIMGDISINASWTPRNDTKYQVEYYLQNLDGSFSYAETEQLAGTTDEQITAGDRIIAHHTFDPSQGESSGIINCDGTLVLKVYYTRNDYTFSIASENEAYGSITGSGVYRYGSVSFTSTVTVNAGCEFLGWYSGERCLSNDESYKFTATQNVEARFGVKAEMQGFVFESTTTECFIKSVKTEISRQMTDLVIPCYVTFIKEKAFLHCRKLESITVESGNATYHSAGNCLIETASKTLILGCQNSVIPTNGSVTAIGNSAFGKCIFLESIEIPSSVISIGAGAFFECESLASITIPASVSSIGADAFSYCENLQAVIFEGDSQLSAIEGGVFKECVNLASITLPNTVSKIGDGAFHNCKSLGVITLPDAVTDIGKEAFRGCSGLSSVTLKNLVSTVGDGAFYDCGALLAIALPNSVTSIGNHAFYGCKSIASITIPAGVLSIGNSAFYGCRALLTVNFDANSRLGSIGNYAFARCSGLLSVAIPNSVSTVGENAFENCSALASIVIPASIESIGEWAFLYCSSLKNVYFRGTEDRWLLIFNNNWWDSDTKPNPIIYEYTGE